MQNGLLIIPRVVTLPQNHILPFHSSLYLMLYLICEVPRGHSLKFIFSITCFQVFDRRKQRLVEELIDGKIVLSMRAIYQSKIGLTLISAGVWLNKMVISV